MNEGVGCGFRHSLSVDSEATFSKTKVSVTMLMEQGARRRGEYSIISFY